MIEVRMSTTHQAPALAFHWVSEFQAWATKTRGTSAAKFQVYLFQDSTEGQHLGQVTAALNWLDRNQSVVKADAVAEKTYREIMAEAAPPPVEEKPVAAKSGLIDRLKKAVSPT